MISCQNILTLCLQYLLIWCIGDDMKALFSIQLQSDHILSFDTAAQSEKHVSRAITLDISKEME